MAGAGTSDDRKVVRLTAERLRRLERRMEAVEAAVKGATSRLDATCAQLDQAVDVLTRLVRVVAGQNARANRNFTQLAARLERLGDRLDGLMKAVTAGRTADTRRLAAAERQLAGLERRTN